MEPTFDDITTDLNQVLPARAQGPVFVGRFFLEETKV
jgi:hypothetical protein